MTLLLTVIAVAGLGVAPGGADKGAHLSLELAGFTSPRMGNVTGRDRPAHVAYAATMRFDGEEGVTRLDRRLASNTVTVAGDEWGHGAPEEWRGSLGLIAGGIPPWVDDASAEHFYVWAGYPEGAALSDGDQVSWLRGTFGAADPYTIPWEPTASKGQLRWDSETAAGAVLRGTTRTHSRVQLPDGTFVQGPATEFRRAMYTHSALLSAAGGDVRAEGEDVPAPEFAFELPAPLGTVMNVQFIGYTTDGPWSGKLSMGADFRAGSTSGITGTYRLPISATLKSGGVLPQRFDSDRVATPQFSVPVSMISIPLLPEHLGPGVNDVFVIADLDAGQELTGLLGLRQPDGTVLSKELSLRGPASYRWRIRDGRMMALTTEEQGLIDGDGDVYTPFDAATTSVGAGGTAVGNPSPAATTDEPAPAAAAFTLERGRPVLHDVDIDGRRVLDRYVVERVVTDTDVVVLGESTLDGHAVTWASPDGLAARARAAYRAGRVLVVVALEWDPHRPRFRATIDSHSLDGTPAPHRVEARAISPRDASPVDLLSGRLQTPTRLVAGPLSPRLVLDLGGLSVRADPLWWSAHKMQISGGGAEALELRVTTIGPEVWNSPPPISFQLEPVVVPEAVGEFTGVHVRRGPVATRRPSMTLAHGEESRDHDGQDALAITFSAQREDGTAVLQADVKQLALVIDANDGTNLFSGSVTPSYTPDGGRTWGTVLIPAGEVPPVVVNVYAQAVLADGVIGREHSPDVPTGDWEVRVDRLPLKLSAGADGTVVGETEPRAAVTVAVPELGLRAQGSAAADGRFTIPLDLPPSARGEYDVVARSTSVWPRDTPVLRLDPPVYHHLPDDEVGTAATRLRVLPGAPATGVVRSSVDVPAASAFLATRFSGGAYDGSLRATAAAVRALARIGAPVSGESEAYLDALRSGQGWAWRAGEPAGAVPSVLAASGLRALGRAEVVDTVEFLRADGAADAAPGADAPSIEATSLVVAELAETERLDRFDPWRRLLLTRWLRDAQPVTPGESVLRAAALERLGTPVLLPPGDELDVVAARVAAGLLPAEALAPFQTARGGFGWHKGGDTADALATGLALSAWAARSP